MGVATDVPQKKNRDISPFKYLLDSRTKYNEFFKVQFALKRVKAQEKPSHEDLPR